MVDCPKWFVRMESYPLNLKTFSLKSGITRIQNGDYNMHVWSRMGHSSRSIITTMSGGNVENGTTYLPYFLSYFNFGNLEDPVPVSIYYNARTGDCPGFTNTL
jgi:hypothetical protein